MKNILVLIISLGLLVGMNSCASMYSKGDEQTLSAAGFQIVSADTPQKKANLKKLQAYQVVPHRGASGATRYVYADPRNNRIFVGDRFAYDQYQRQIAQNEVNMDENMEDIDYEDSEFGWGEWGMGW